MCESSGVARRDGQAWNWLMHNRHHIWKLVQKILHSEIKISHKAGVKLTNIFGLTMWGWQKLNHLTSHLNNVETCVINMITQNLYFGFCQTFQPNKCVRDDVHRNWPIKSQLNSRSCKHGGPLLEVAVALICQWIQAHGRSAMSKN